MLIRNTHIVDCEGLWQIVIENDKITQILPILPNDIVFDDQEMIDAQEGIAYPPFVEPHIHLQGRFDDYPKRRGVTRIKEMLARNINVCFGHDDVFDPWYPLGTANMLQVLHMGLHVCQLMGYQQINDGLKLVTENSAKALGINNYEIKEGHLANFIILPAKNGFMVLMRCVDKF